MTSRLRALAVSAAVLALTIGVTSSAHGATSDPDARQTGGYLARQLEANDYVLPGFFSTDWGLTIDAVFALAATGVGGRTAARTIERIETDGWEYGQYSCYSDIGSYAKTALALQIGGGDPTSFDVSEATDFGPDFCDGAHPAYGSHYGDTTGGTVDLIQLIRDEIALNGGRPGAQSNHFDVSLAVLALARTTEGVPASAVTYLKSQQCLDQNHANYGGFGYPSSHPAETPCSTADGDGTGFELSALLAAGVSTSDPTVTRAVTWMQNRQNANGSFPASNPDGAAGNSNSTGLVSNAARQVGGTAATAVADKADTYLRSLHVGCDDPVGSDDDPTQPGFARTWVGAMAYVSSAFTSATTSGIQPMEEDQWRRATAQAVLGIASLPGWSQLTLTGAEGGTPQPMCSPVTLTIGGTTRPVAAGQYTTVTISGLARHEAFRVALSGTTLRTGVADDEGKATVSVKVPTTFGTSTNRTLRVTGSAPNRVGDRKLVTGGRKTLKPTVARSKVKPTKNQKVHVKGLLPGEKMTIAITGRTTRTAYASSTGTYTLSFTATSKTGTKKVKVCGASCVRSGRTSFKVAK